MMKDELMKYYHVNPDKVEILYPPINIEKFNRNKESKQEEYRQKYGFSNNKKSFIFISSGHKRKGLPLLLEIFKELIDTEFELLIAGKPEVKTDLPNVKYIGFVKDTDELYIAADFTIHPSIYEPFGQIVTESLQCGTPVIISGMVGAKEIVGNKEGIVVNSFDKDVWINEIKKLENKEFIIPEDFALNKGLTLEQHMEKMLEAFEKLKAKPS